MSLNKACSMISLLLLFSCENSEMPKTNRTHRTPERIVSLVPAVTEMLFAIGADERVVGVSDYDTYPSNVLKLPRVGALLNPDLERIFKLKPDLVIIYGTQTTLAEKLMAAGIRQYPFIHGSIGETLDYIIELGRTIDMNPQAVRLTSEMNDALEEIRKSAPKRRPRVFLVHSRETGNLGSFYSGGGKSFFNELIEIAGGRNIFGDVDDDSIQPALEEILARQPEIIVELLPSSKNKANQMEQRRDDWNALNTLPAVRQRQVHVLVGDYLLLVGPRLHLAAKRFAEIIQN